RLLSSPIAAVAHSVSAAVAPHRLLSRFVACLFFLTPPATAEIYTLSLHDALPICLPSSAAGVQRLIRFLSPVQLLADSSTAANRSEEHTSELQSRENLVCRLLLEKKK